MVPIGLVIALFVVVMVASSGRSVQLPGLSEKRKREMVEQRRCEEAARAEVVQLAASRPARYGDLSAEQEQSYLDTRQKLEELRKAA